ncbi:2'-hydroxyisoflavone reductase [Fusarium tjaetaba]|uniref:2'-hydroxyisoflavone reductase n=1 Tax=Fusarium tjaetaba TaxID=1567544 RepID=A0A8H5VH36_9HYPO|nr:2'-hydroxyisoflavone reductase [Fusarium tjaetaba]KAF5623251.1 2'-hydroxyisoflavone reductase [Fusarium tjaetaba]
MTIQKVAVVGGSGLIGSKIVDSLLKAGFEVTAITRNESAATFPDKVVVKRVDLASVDSVKEALAGQDAVVSAAATAAAGSQKVIIDAAVAAQVPRFIPSEFGIPSRQNRDTKIGKILGAKIQNTDYLIELAEKHDWFSWTGLSNGLFLDSGLKSDRGFINIRDRKIRITDSGNEPYSTTSLAFVGEAVAAILKKPEETKNKYLNIAGVTTTQNEVLKIAEQVTGDKFEVSHVTGAEQEKIGDEKIAKGDFSAFGNYLEQFLFADGAGHALKGDENAIGLLGLKEENLEEVVKSVVAEIK